MGLVAPYTGEVELDAVMDRFEADNANFSDAECVLLGLFAAVIEGLFQAQTSAVARDRLAERLADGAGNINAPVTAAALRDLATVAKQVRTELLNTVVGLTAAELADCDGEVAAHQFTLLGPVH